LAATKDATLADTYSQLLNDQSYSVIRATAVALGQTKSSAAYDALTRLIDQPSWRDTIRASGLNGLAALGDKRALDLGFKYAAAGNGADVRAAALALLGNTGHDDPRTFPTLSAALTEGFDNRNFPVLSSAANGLVQLGDERALAAFEELRKKNPSPQVAATVTNFEQRLKSKLAAAKPPTR
jgi:aminopeptidase N